MATKPGRGGRRLPCFPVRSLRRRTTSTYRCYWRRRASVPLTTPLIKVTDQILALRAVLPLSQTTLCFILLTARLCMPFSKVAVFRLCFSLTILPLLLLASLQSCSVLFFFVLFLESLPISMEFLLAGKEIVAFVQNRVNCEMFFFHLFFFSPKKLYCSFGTCELY